MLRRARAATGLLRHLPLVTTRRSRSCRKDTQFEQEVIEAARAEQQARHRLKHTGARSHLNPFTLAPALSLARPLRIGRNSLKLACQCLRIVNGD